MKLWNHGKVPDAAILPLLREAAIAVGCGHHGQVIVKVTCGRYRGQNGTASTWATWYRNRRGRRVSCRGAIDLTVIQPDTAWITRHPGFALADARQPDALACDLFRLAVHEFKHIIDARHGLRQAQRNGTRRPPHRNRPEEKRAYAAVDRVMAALTPAQTETIRLYADALARLRRGEPQEEPMLAAACPDPLDKTRRRLARAARELEKLDKAEKALAKRRIHWNHVAAGCRKALTA